MNWTVSLRIIAGFALLLILTLSLAILGITALGETRDAYRSALMEEQQVVTPALRAESMTSEATSEFQRFLLNQDTRFAVLRDSALASSQTLLGQLQVSAPDAEMRANWSRAVELLTEWRSASDLAMTAAREGRTDEALRIWETQSLPIRLELHDLIERGVSQARERSSAETLAAEASAEQMQRRLLFGAGIAILLGLGSALLLNRAITTPLRETTSVLASSAAEIMAATTQQAASAAETSAAVVQTSTTVDEVTQTAAQSAERARLVAESSSRAAEIGTHGRRAVEDSVAAMTAVQEQVESIAASILTLAEQAQSIGEIIAVVGDLASQTNLLALNAAVEAARAGEHGKGFAVVAGEVRNLADQSKKATVQVRQILGDIQRATSAAVMATEQGTQQAAAGTARVEAAGETIRSLADAVTEAAHASAQIVASAGQQAAGMEQIRQAMGSIHEATQQTLASTRQAEHAAEDLNEQGNVLLEFIGGSHSNGRRRTGLSSRT